ncbi:MAG: anaerobic glycerol-3-phosphate dehydrogenase subunit GlpB [Candidatus Thorarchaeota archaeon]
MDLDTDVLIIGGGMAGLAAGIIANESGARTVLVRKGQSATAYSSGAVDIIGYLPESSESFASPSSGLESVITLYPFHPYGLFIPLYPKGESKSDPTLDQVVSNIKDALNWLKKHLENTPASLAGDFSENINPITVLGTTKPTCFVQETMYPPKFNDDDVLLFVGIRGHPDFDATTAASTYLDHQSRYGLPPNRVASCDIDLAPFGKGYNISSIELARHLDHTGSIENLIVSLRDYASRSEATAVALPPVLGLRRAKENQDILEKELGLKVFELLSLPPSVPGLRLQNALEDVYKSTGGSLLVGHEVVSFSHDETQIKSVTAKSPQREASITLKSIVLASGKFIGGGLQSTDTGLKETVFNLMTVNGVFLSAAKLRPDRSTNVRALPEDGHDIFSSGLSVDPQFRPVNHDGNQFANNLFCAGSLLASYNYAAEKSGLGVALVTGLQAGKNAANSTREVD